MQARVIFLLIFTLLIVTFAVMNIQPVTIDFFFYEAEIKLIFVIIFSILVGAIFMVIISSMNQIKMIKKIKALEKEKAKLKEELEQLKVTNQEIASKKDTDQITENNQN
ncbi:hypothetical protein BHF71_01420 [Vulcanibacillus modesticaldus]|uniref:Lipopolysaccharide assembly protein A domain-containing protein n=1 Tax=Vulcanibacillus modesticaldus TaxID=337097 RepID=A0A1D2YVY6_9BACI|nr:LapA family protein [Vulcanibacillus modesticaldus]OEF99862.1 hypothetical protein BHF71_01420 [Vulcanibacillus modesticaldus]